MDTKSTVKKKPASLPKAKKDKHRRPLFGRGRDSGGSLLGSALPILSRSPSVAAVDWLQSRASHYRTWRDEKRKDAADHPPRVSVLALLSFSTRRERWIMALGLLSAILSGLSMPAWLILLAQSLETFNNLGKLLQSGGSEAVQEALNNELMKLVIGFIVVGVVSLVSGTVYVSLWTYTGERQSLRIKEGYVRSAFRQDATWFDLNNPEELPTRIASSMSRIADSIGRQMADAFSNLWAAAGCLAVSMVLNAPLALIMLCAVPIAAIVGGVVGIFIRRSSRRSGDMFAAAGALATEAISGIKTVASLCAQPWAMENYERTVRKAQESSVRSGFLSGLSAGLVGFLFYCAYTVSYLFGTEQVAKFNDNKKCILGMFGDCSVGVSGAHVLTCIYGVMLSATFFGLMAPGVQAINVGRTAAVDVFATIEREPEIDASAPSPHSDRIEENGRKIDNLTGSLEFRDVMFAYPSRPKQLIFKNFNLTITAGKSLGVVGPSGSGKSTISRLLLRFYDPVSGDVLIDGVPMTGINVRWWRSRVGYVPQEPSLFPGTIEDNIAVGKPGASKDEIVSAAKAACAHDFIMALPRGYDTFFSGTSVQLSGGQMQRIAIARAIVRDPAILLLDEATSALDVNSERQVQLALENIRSVKRVTTVSVAHRLSTIMSADSIAVISEGGVAELGTHQELLEEGGVYATLCESQGITQESKDEEETPNPAEKGTRKEDGTGNSSLKPIQSLPVENNLQNERLEVKALPEDVEEEELAPKSRLWMHNKPEWPYMAMGIIGACMVGALQPSEAILTARLIANFYITDSTEQMKSENFVLAMSFLAFAGASLFGNIMMGSGFSVSGYRLTRRMRVAAFGAIVRRGIEWFDLPQHSTGELTTRLEEDAEAVSKVTGWALGYKIRVFATISAGCLIALISSWKMGLIALACIPVIMGASVIQAIFSSRKIEIQHGLSSATILEQGLREISAVQAYNLQDKVCEDYCKALQPDAAGKAKEGFVAGIVFGFSQFAIFISFAILFLSGTKLMGANQVTFVDFLTSVFAIMLGAFGIAQVNADFNAENDGLAAAARIYTIVDEPLDASDPLSEEGVRPDSLSGGIEFRSCCFQYPTRPDHPIYFPSKGRDGLSLSIGAKESCAFVGKSGSGKSTALQLLLRFYNVSSGGVLLDDRNIQELNLSWLRQSIGYVGQQPVLFAGTVRENILLGKADATEEEVVAAAKAANAHEFVTKFKNGYDTDIGVGGSLLSGGQKQRIAIARAIVKDPQILVLDEATSALDNESERVVQAALDDLQRRQPRTTLIVAHRLITIKDCDKIAVLDGGGLKELGSHDRLLEEKGLYLDLWKKQGPDTK